MQSQTTTESLLISTYGPVMTLPDLAECFHRSINGLRVSLSRDNETSRLLRKARFKMGRRCYFRTEAIAQVINQLSQEGA